MVIRSTVVTFSMLIMYDLCTLINLLSGSFSSSDFMLNTADEEKLSERESAKIKVLYSLERTPLARGDADR